MDRDRKKAGLRYNWFEMGLKTMFTVLIYELN